MNGNQIRTKFLNFFATKDHKIFPSDSLVPKQDPSVLFTSAGMNQFKPQFLGHITGYRRAASCQKCLRTADLEKVGISLTHHTFFEMLGNFSFGDYFKLEAITWAWDFVTKELKLPNDSLWISVHEEDNEAYDIWTNRIGIPKKMIVKLGDKENFWPAEAPKKGPNGPCGPCSEIYYDWGKEIGCKRKTCNPACSCGRFIEIWNLVFTQYDRQADGRLLPLPSKNIDTGMGLERITAVMQNVRDNYQTDLFMPILTSLCEQLKRENILVEQNWLNTKAKTLCDHLRAVTFAIGDGVMPSNEERGYVIRKLIRLSIMILEQIGIKHPFCYKLVYCIAKIMQQPYPELLKAHESIAAVVKKEEEIFWTVLNEREPQNEATFKEFAENPEKFISAGISTSTHLAAYQYDTLGVPLEISKKNAKKYGQKISDVEFEKIMDKLRQRSRNKSKLSGEIFTKNIGHLLAGIKSQFIGYDYLESEAKVLAIIKGKNLVNEAQVNAEVDIVLDKTPFYAEAGGQIGDQGFLTADKNFMADVIDTQKTEETFVHRIKIKRGKLKNDLKVKAIVNQEKRSATAKNHTTTHILQYALRKILGSHVEQSGSLVSWEKLRFDFRHSQKIPSEIIERIESLTNEIIQQNLTVSISVKDINQAKAQGALAFFGEKYGQMVRVLAIGDISIELCGGTHVKNTGEIGLFKIINESSIAQGLRRIEAVTAKVAIDLVQHQQKLIADLKTLLKVEADKLSLAIEKLLQQCKNQGKQIEKLKSWSREKEVETLLKKVARLCSVNTIIAELTALDIDDLRLMCDALKKRIDPAICVLTSVLDEKVIIVVAVSQTLVKKGIDAVKIIKEFMNIVGGTGGGKSELAQAGSKNINGIRLALKQAPKVIEQLLLTLE